MPKSNWAVSGTLKLLLIQLWQSAKAQLFMVIYDIYIIINKDQNQILFLQKTYHYADKTCLFNRCRGCMMYKSEKYKAYKLDEVRDDGAEWIRKTLRLVKAEHVNTCGAQSFIGKREITREVMAQKLSAALRIMYRQSLYIDQMETYNQKLHSDVIDSQRTVVDLQKELLATKEKQLDDLKSVVKASVEDTVKSEFKTYSAAVKE